MLVTLLTFYKEIHIPQCEFFSIHSFQDIVFPIYSFQYIKQSNLLILFIVGNSNPVLSKKKKKLNSFHVISFSTSTKLGTLTEKYLSFCFLADLGITFYDWLEFLQCKTTSESCCYWTDQQSALPQAIIVILPGF